MNKLARGKLKYLWAKWLGWSSCFKSDLNIVFGMAGAE